MPELRTKDGAALPELSVVLPTRNEADNLEPLLERLRAALKDVDFELVFVDDSDDQTAQRLSQEAGADPHMQVIHRVPELRQGGLSTAVVLGLHQARGQLVCVMDADLQHPPETIPAMLQAERDGADLVVASRYLPGGSRAGLATGTRQLISRAANLLVRTVFFEARASTDPLAGFFLCRASLLRGVEFRPIGFKILLELLVCSGPSRVTDVPLRFQARSAGASKASFAQGLLFLKHIWSLVWDVPGSARVWKYAAVGSSGLLLFLLVLEFCGNQLGWPALAAWSVAFVLSVGWNFSWNLRLTFADLRRERYPLMRRYISSTLTAGGAQLVAFLGLASTSLPLVLDGLLAAILGMGVNAALNWQLARRHRRPAGDGPIGVDHFLAQLARVGRAQRAELLDQAGRGVAFWGPPTSMGAELLTSLAERSRRDGVPVLWTEPLSNRPQARTNVELASVIVLALNMPGFERFTVTLQRSARAAFSQADLEASMRQLERMVPRLRQEAIGVAPEVLAADEIPALTAELSGNRGTTGPGTASRLG